MGFKGELAGKRNHVARLEYIDNNGAKAVISLDPSAPVIIGRNPGSTIHTTNPSVSRNHGKVFQQGNGWMVKDLGSSNGTFINDEQIQQGNLKPDDRIRCGDFVLTFLEDDGKAPEPPRPARSEDPFGFSDADFEKRMDEPRPRASVAKTDAHLPRMDPPRKTERSSPAIRPSEPAEDRRSDEEERRRQRREERRRKRDEERERDEQRAKIRPHGERVTSGTASEQLVRQIKEQAAEIETLSQDYKEQKSMVSELELKLEELENKATRYEVELDSITEKYVQIKDQLTLSKERLDETREELADRDDKIFQLEGRLAEMDSELESARERASSSQEYVSTYKIKLTQKERQIEDLQRQYDLMEFEYRAAKEEMKSLQEAHNVGAGDTAKLERRINQLREIIADKENVISELRLELENKDIEIRQVRMGMGMTDLEDEKRKLLEDYYQKNREVDQLRDELKSVQLNAQEAQEKLREVEAELERKASALSDITTHPDYKAKLRENKRLEERTRELEADLQDAEGKLSEFSADEKKRLQGEVAFFKRKSAAIEEKLARSNERISTLEDQLEKAQTAPAPPPPTQEVTPAEVDAEVSAVKERLATDLEDLYTIFTQWRSNFSLFRTYLKEINAIVATLSESPEDKLPDALKTLVATNSPTEAMESVHDLLRVVDTDAKALKKGLTRFKKELGG